MWSFKIPQALVIAVLLSLGACGFSPMYGDDAGRNAAEQVRQVEIANIPDRDGQYLRNLLIDRLNSGGRPESAPYLLAVTDLKTSVTNIGIRRDATSTRGLLQTDAHVTLIDKKTGAVLLSRDYRSVGAYNQLDNQFATLVSRGSLSAHVLEEMSDNILTDLGLYFRRTPQ
jgi:LPS-assembly lipoprotein